MKLKKSFECNVKSNTQAGKIKPNKTVTAWYAVFAGEKRDGLPRTSHKNM